MPTTTMGKFVRKFNDYTKRGRWGKRTVKYGVIKREVVERRCKDPELNLTRTLSDTTKLNMTVKTNQDAMIFMAMELGDDYDELVCLFNELQRDNNEVKAKNNVLSTNFSVLKKENDSLQNEVESLKKRLRLANERNFNSQFENQNNTIIRNKVI